MNARIFLSTIATIALGAGLTLGCNAGDNDSLDRAHGIDEIVTPDDEGPPVATDDLALVSEAACNDLELKARELVARHRVCADGGSCTLVNMTQEVPQTCLVPFQCYTPVASNLDINDFVAQARDISNEYNRIGCMPCPQALCLPENELAANCGQGICDVIDLPVAEVK